MTKMLGYGGDEPFQRGGVLAVISGCTQNKSLHNISAFKSSPGVEKPTAVLPANIL